MFKTYNSLENTASSMIISVWSDGLGLIQMEVCQWWITTATLYILVFRGNSSTDQLELRYNTWWNNLHNTLTYCLISPVFILSNH